MTMTWVDKKKTFVIFGSSGMKGGGMFKDSQSGAAPL